MEERLHTSSESLSKLVRWAHSHGTICSLIPGLKHLLTEGTHGNLTAMWGCGAGHAYHWPLSTASRSSQKEARSCYQDNREAAPQPSSGGCDRGFLARSSKAKGGGSSSAQTRPDSCDFSNCSEPSEADDNAEEFGGNLFDMACESSATDEDRDADYELPSLPRKRGGASKSGATEGGAVKRIKQEVAESYYSPGTDSDPKPCSSARPAPGHAALPHKPFSGERLGPSPSSALSSSPHASLSLPQAPPGQHEQNLNNLEEEGRAHGSAPSEALPNLEAGRAGLGEMNPDLERLVEQALDGRTDALGEAPAGPALCEIQRLRGLLHAERSRSEVLGETISSLKQDKELLQQELTKKAELICDFLQDQLRPDKRRTHSSNQMTHPSNQMNHQSNHMTHPSNHVTHPSNHMTHPSNHMTHPSNQMTHPSNHMTHPSNHMEPGSSHMVPFVEESFDSPALFDSFEEVELHPLDRHRVLKSKRSRDGENTRVRMKNVVGVIARYMAALQEFRRSVSMKVAFDRVGVDRNTISRTAAIAELSLAAPEVFHALAPWDEKEETLAHYAHRCRQAMDDNIKAKIKSMKAKGDLLPIVSK